MPIKIFISQIYVTITFRHFSTPYTQIYVDRSRSEHKKELSCQKMAVTLSRKVMWVRRYYSSGLQLFSHQQATIERRLHAHCSNFDSYYYIPLTTKFPSNVLNVQSYLSLLPQTRPLNVRLCLQYDSGLRRKELK